MSRLEYITNEVIEKIDFSKHIMGEEPLQDDEFTDIEDVLIGFRNSRLSLAFILRFEEEIRLKYAKEVAQASLEKASENLIAEVDMFDLNGLCFTPNEEAEKSIKNPKNIILL